jgi:LysM repeat protein
MDRNERILNRVLQERRGRPGPLSLASPWLLVGEVVLLVAGVVVAFRVEGTSGTGDAPPVQDSSSAEALTATVPQPTATITRKILPVATAQQSSAGRPRQYVVQPGDSVESIATRSGLRPATIASVNELEDPDVLQPGRELLLPDTDGVVHIVERGETLRDIADRYDVDVTGVVTANDLHDPDHITAGLRLFIPGARTSVFAQHP